MPAVRGAQGPPTRMKPPSITRKRRRHSTPSFCTNACRCNPGPQADCPSNGHAASLHPPPRVLVCTAAPHMRCNENECKYLAGHPPPKRVVVPSSRKPLGSLFNEASESSRRCPAEPYIARGGFCQLGYRAFVLVTRMCGAVQTMDCVGGGATEAALAFRGTFLGLMPVATRTFVTNAGVEWSALFFYW